jgi:phytanoyl-CoA hydroxylase
MDQTAPHYRSRFGGMWIDETDQDAVAARIAAIPDPVLRGRITAFERDGYVVLEQAVPHRAIDDYLRQYDDALAAGEELLMSAPFGPMSEPLVAAKTSVPGAKILDTAMLLPAGAGLSFAPAISRFVQVLFEGPALAFQSLHFVVGSTQTIHQDTAYVVIGGKPMRLIASWIALEDVTPGSGELVYYVGGHRMREYAYANGTSKHFNADRDGHKAHQAHLRYLNEEAARCGFPKASFLPKKGDVLLWHADLPHGGGEITRPGCTRRSLVTHYCPAAETPYYFGFIPEQNRRKVPAANGNYYASLYFPPERFACARKTPTPGL